MLSVSRRPAFLGLAFAAVGTFFYSKRVIHADSSEEKPGIVIQTLIPHSGDIVKVTAMFESPGPVTQVSEDAIVRMQLGALASWATIDGNTGIARFDSASMPSSAPRLDSTVTSSFTPPFLGGSAWTQFTMQEVLLNTGWGNVLTLAQRLHATLVGGLLEVYERYEHRSEHSDVGGMFQYEENIEEGGFEDAVLDAMKKTFLSVDDFFVQRPFGTLSSPQPLPKSSLVASVSAALSGSSALVAFYDHVSRKLRVANTGNTRAVLGRKSTPTKGGQQTYTVHVLSDDHTTDAAPGLSRAFGLGKYKWTRDMQERLHRDFMGDPPLEETLPHILTAEPSVRMFDIQPGDFLVMATHGLWNSLTNEEAVGLVGLWVNRNMRSVAYGTPSEPKDVVVPSDLPALAGTDNTTTYRRWGMEKRFLCIDNNAALHLTRNALGGADINWTATILAVQPPRAQQLSVLFNVIAKACVTHKHLEQHRDLSITEADNTSSQNLEDNLHKLIKDMVVQTDNIIVTHPLVPLKSPHNQAQIATQLDAALSGFSMAMVSYDVQERMLQVANVGSTRVVLGRRAGRTKSGQQAYSVHVLSEDHTCDTAPGVTRAIGLAAYNWSLDVQKLLHKDYLGDPPMSLPSKHLTAEPSVRSIKLEPGDFVVMASNGLWNSLTNEEVVGLVGVWFNKNMAPSSNHLSENQGNLSADAQILMPRDLPLACADYKPLPWKGWGVEKAFICVDDSAADHLAHNALGGAHPDLFNSFRHVRAPRARKIRSVFTTYVRNLPEFAFARDDMHLSVLSFDGL
ncbi:hypothetical protein DXG01_006938 [Tephrocybe rancida]|nr:hypothetical protein DXG01_006938 [Tephrocybe rancida]